MRYGVSKPTTLPTNSENGAVAADLNLVIRRRPGRQTEFTWMTPLGLSGCIAGTPWCRMSTSRAELPRVSGGKGISR
jgi:hypothetical protein